MASFITRLQPWKQVSAKSSSLTKNISQSLSNRCTPSTTSSLPTNRTLSTLATTNRIAASMVNFNNGRIFGLTMNQNTFAASSPICGSIALLSTTAVKTSGSESAATSESEEEGDSDGPVAVAEPKDPPLPDESQDKVLNLVINFLKQQPHNTFQLSFLQYQEQKKKLRLKQRMTGVVTGLTTATGSGIVMAPILDYFYPGIMENPEQLIMGTFDPVVFSGICCISTGLVGYAIGAALFKAAYSTVIAKQSYADWSVRNNDFLRRLEKRRVVGDSEFEDDFYGESIRTLSDYRQWCRTMDGKRAAIRKLEDSKRKVEMTHVETGA